jgi:uncharacterized LabA/DUF88 family protein
MLPVSQNKGTTGTFVVLLVDFDNVWLGLRATGPHDINPATLIQRLRQYAQQLGTVLAAKLYAAPKQLSPGMHREFLAAGYEVVIGTRPGGSPDIRMALDGQSLLFTRPDIDIFIIASGDSDFQPLTEAVTHARKRLIVVAPKAVASSLLTEQADEFVALEGWFSKQEESGHRQKRKKTREPARARVAEGSSIRDPQRRLRVFLCHSKHDKAQVRELYSRLKGELGIEPWLDEESLLPGQDWELEITKTVRASHCVIVCLSRQAIDKEGFVHKEIRFALDAADHQPEGVIFLIPVKLEPCEVPERLRRYHWVDLFEPGGYQLLLRSLQARANGLT